MSAEQVFAAASVVVSLVAIGLLTDPAHAPEQAARARTQRAGHSRCDRAADRSHDRGKAFAQLEDIAERYPDEESIRTVFHASPDDRALVLVAQYVETVACLARRRVLDASLLVDAVGFQAALSLEYDPPLRRTPAARSRQRVSLRELRVARSATAPGGKTCRGHEARPELTTERFGGIEFKV